jgi:hypothetical protein
MVIECINETQKATLLRAKIVYNSKDCVYVTFRKPLTSQNSYLSFLGYQGDGESIGTRSFLVGSPMFDPNPRQNQSIGKMRLLVKSYRRGPIANVGAISWPTIGGAASPAAPSEHSWRVHPSVFHTPVPACSWKLPWNSSPPWHLRNHLASIELRVIDTRFQCGI